MNALSAAMRISLSLSSMHKLNAGMAAVADSHSSFERIEASNLADGMPTNEIIPRGPGGLPAGEGVTVKHLFRPILAVVTWL